MSKIFQMVLTFILMALPISLFAKAGFVGLPNAGDATSVYVLCNPTGEHGFADASPPNDKNNTCSITTEELISSPLNAPLKDFRLVGMLVSDVPMPARFAGKDSAVAVLSEAIWRNKDNTECILGTHLEMKDAPLSNGQYWEINDIARTGFAGKEIAIAYFYKPHSEVLGGNTEVLFRAGRTYTSVKNSINGASLPTTKNAPSANVAISENNSAGYSDNWVDFTTDLSFKDMDGITRAISSIFYIKYPCDGRDPVTQPNAIHLRYTGKSEIFPKEIAVPGLVPVGGVVEQY